MLAVANDIDGTAYQDFIEIHRFLNTTQHTTMGYGLGLDISDSFWMYNVNNKKGYIDANNTLSWQEQISYFKGGDWNTPYFSKEIKHFINAGWIDSIHSFGDFSRNNYKDIQFKREHAVKAVEELEKEDIKIKVWINHGNAANVQNFGGRYKSTEYQQGDVPNTAGYHTDLTIPYGIEFLWDSKGDNKIGHNSMIFPVTLKDGQKIWGFKRYTHKIKDDKYLWQWDIYNLHNQLSKEHLDKIVDQNWYSIIANHMGNSIDDRTLPYSAIEAFTRLKKYQDEGKILVARTSRLLEYNRCHQFIEYEAFQADTDIDIYIKGINDPQRGFFVPIIDQIRGITFYTGTADNVKIYINTTEIPQEEIQINYKDGVPISAGITWHKPDSTDYSQNIFSE
ncbi:hypothetical protein Gferi_17815 [Geosporobacter ferrireducens]|uniref:Uncharacterized protein n=1 Tax=Geosporobacter ferrireducens TaxID=1424294 RepID=A0A1D8GQQ6_9FIRM|nr:hypothetical protein Gferi_17815 [Geosporobacter ferrireducens]